MRTLSLFFSLSVLAAVAAFATHATEATATDGDWPQLLGPGRTGIARSPKLIEAWPAKGPRLVWQSDKLPYAPVCGIGSPIISGNKVYTYANTVEPLKGIKPFKLFLAELGYVPDMPQDLEKKINDAQFGEKRNQCKNDDEVEAFSKEFLATLDPEQAKRFSESIKLRLKLGRKSFDSGGVALFVKAQDQEVESREDFMNMFVEWFHHNIYHGGQITMLTAFADKVYKDQKFIDQVICLDLASGKELWRKSFPGTKKNYGVEFGCSGTPLVNKDRLYLRGSGGLFCLDANTGEPVWQVKSAGGNNSPVLANGVIYCVLENLKAFDAASGKELWSQPKVIGESETPAIWTHAGVSYVLCQVDAPRYYQPFFCLNAADGKEQWTIVNGKETPFAGQYNALTVIGDTLYMRNGQGCAALALSPTKYEKIWFTPGCGDQGGAPVVYQDHVYLCGQSYGTNVITVLDQKTGAITLNIKDQKAGRCSNALIADGKIFFNGYGDYRINHLLVAKTTPDKYEEIGNFQAVNVAACSSPAFSNGRVLLRLQRGLACYDMTAAGN